MLGSKAREMRLNLTGLRGLAALIVVLGHLAHEGLFLPVFDGTAKLGVWLFFILSAYLMTTRYLPRDPKQALGEYVRARIGRVFPLYYGILVVSLAFVGIEAWRYQVDALPFLMIAAPQELWAVPVEVQFYACFAAFWIAWHKGWLASRWRMGVLVVGVLTLSVVVTLGKYLAAINPSGLNLYLYIFMLGMAIALHENRVMAVVDRIGPKALTVAAVVLLVASMPRLQPLPIPNRADPFAIAASVAVFALALRGTAFASPLLLWVGQRSYGLYLFHHLVLTGVVYAFGRNPLWAIPVVAVSLGLAAASWRWFEQPVDRWVRGRQRAVASAR